MTIMLSWPNSKHLNKQKKAVRMDARRLFAHFDLFGQVELSEKKGDASLRLIRLITPIKSSLS
jgi:hypothetical protein